jgi:multidrug efflux system membrane fusion protein
MNTHDKPKPDQAAAPRAKSHALWWVVVIVLGLGVGGYFYFTGKKAGDEGAATAGGAGATKQGAGGMGGGGMGGKGGGRGGRFGGGGPVPVSSAAVATGELRVHLTALGSVTALNTITVRSRADGELKKIHFTEGQLVKEGDLLAEIDPRQYQVALEQAEGQLARDTALLENARRDLERYRSAKEAVTQQQVDSAAATVAQYTGSVRADQGSVDNYKLQLSYCRVTAPITGRVGLRLVDQGNLVRAGDSTGLVVITQEEPIAVSFSVPEDNLPQIRKALAEGRELSVDALDRAMQNRLAKGKLLAVDNQIDSATGTVRLKALFANEDHGLFPNQFVNVRMLTDVQANVLLIPNSAVQISTASRFVFVVKPDDTVERRNVTIGRTEGERTVVTEGLAVGDIVVTEGLDRLQNGSKVAARVAPPAAKEGAGRGEGRGGDGKKKKKSQ